MGRITKVLVCGPKNVGKTAWIMRLAYDKFPAEYTPTLEDRDVIQVDTERGVRECLVLLDTGGVDAENPDVINSKFYFQIIDAIVLMYAVNDIDSFNRMDLLRREVEKAMKERKDREMPPIVVIGNKTDLAETRKVESDFAINWSQREKVKLFEVSALDKTNYIEPISYIASKLFPAIKEGKFTLTKRVKDKPPGAAIMMDI